MRGHWIGGTRKLNKHWQSGEGSKEFSRWFTTIKYNDEYYCFAPSYSFVQYPHIAYTDYWIGGSIYNNLKGVWTDFGTAVLTPSFNGNMNVNGSYTLEDIRENATIVTRTLNASSRVKVIIPTFKMSLKFEEMIPGQDLPTGYKYLSNPSIPTGAEILWQDDNDISTYEARYSDSLNIVRNTWNAWKIQRLWEGHQINTNQYVHCWQSGTDPDYIETELTPGFYDHDTQYSGVPDAINLMAPIMQQKYSNTDTNLIMPFNDYILFHNALYDYGESKYYLALLKWELVSLDLQERTIV